MHGTWTYGYKMPSMHFEKKRLSEKLTRAFRSSELEVNCITNVYICIISRLSIIILKMSSTV